MIRKQFIEYGAQTDSVKLMAFDIHKTFNSLKYLQANVKNIAICQLLFRF